jgi:superfamily II DNA/RNA helicase
MHGDKSQGQRERALSRFERGDVEVLVATDVAARGIDVADIAHVINFDAPGDRDSYVHRVGRTGRAGARGAGTSFVLTDQAAEMRTIARDLGLSEEFEQNLGHVAKSNRPSNGKSASGQKPGSGSGQRSRRRRRNRRPKVSA